MDLHIISWVVQSSSYILNSQDTRLILCFLCNIKGNQPIILKANFIILKANILALFIGIK